MLAKIIVVYKHSILLSWFTFENYGEIIFIISVDGV